MKQDITTFLINTHAQALYEFTHDIRAWVSQTGISTGLLTLHCKHTSASLTIQENADPDVQLDLTEFFSRLVPEHMEWLRHTMEGPDDMPAHIKTALTDVSLTIPVAQSRPTLGTWQGVYLFEHRKSSHRRQVVAHLIGA